MVLNKTKATFIGLIAILLWSSVIGLMRNVSESLGVTGGWAMIYSVASIFLCVSVGLPNIRKFPKRYLILGGLLFVSYELCLSLSIGYAKTNQQAIEVGMVNYLWPAFTMLGAIIFNNQKANILVLALGFTMAFWGIGLVLGGSQSVDLSSIIINIQANKLSYGLAFSGALMWAIYCTITSRMAKGNNGVTLFFILTALTLWLKYFLFDGLSMNFDFHSAIYLLLASAAMAFGYAAWNTGILHGNITLLAGASYFTPVLSATLAALLLNTPLSTSFWKGAAIVCIG